MTPPDLFHHLSSSSARVANKNIVSRKRPYGLHGPPLYIKLFLLVFALSFSVSLVGSEAPGPVPKPFPERLKWWAEGRFGMFIHWGPVSLKGTEISWSRANTNPKCPNKGAIPAEEYDNLYRNFNPTNFNAAQWVDIARTGGTRYMVLTAKHCDGFLLWHSKVSDYNISASPFRRDVCAELSSAARAQGMRIGWYFSPMDWRDPDFRTERNGSFLRTMQAELWELLSNYGRIDLLWFDWDGREPVYDQAATYPLVKSLQPEIVINNRLDLGPTNSDRQILSPDADYYTPEQHIVAYDDQRPWESCMTLSAKDQWAWGGPSDGVKSFEKCLAMLIGCAGGDGNLLLNVGPMPNGQIPADQAARVRELGGWLGAYGESIYATRGGPFKPGSYGASTRKGKSVYLHIKGWEDEALMLPSISAKVIGSRVLTGGKARVRQTKAGIEIRVPKEDRQPLDTIVVLDLDVDACSIPALAVPARKSVTSAAKASASNVYQGSADFAPEKAIDGDEETRWATDGGVKSAWLELDFGQEKAFDRLSLKQAYPELRRIRRFALEYESGTGWKTCYQGGDPGDVLSVAFPQVKARKVRLNILESTDGPTIKEFQLFSPTTR